MGVWKLGLWGMRGVGRGTVRDMVEEGTSLLSRAITPSTWQGPKCVIYH